MAKNLLNRISDKFHNSVKKDTAKSIGVKQSCYQHLINGRPVKDWMLIQIRRLYGIDNNRNGLTDTEILNLLDKDYPPHILKEILDEYR